MSGKDADSYSVGLHRGQRFCISNKLPSDTDLPWWLRGKEYACIAGDTGLIPAWERSPGEGNGNPFQYSCLKIPRPEEPGWLQSTGLQRVGHNLVTKQQETRRSDSDATGPWTTLSGERVWTVHTAAGCSSATPDSRQGDKGPYTAPLVEGSTSTYGAGQPQRRVWAG